MFKKESWIEIYCLCLVLIFLLKYSLSLPYGTFGSIFTLSIGLIIASSIIGSIGGEKGFHPMTVGVVLGGNAIWVTIFIALFT